MLCVNCRRLLSGAVACGSCGAPARGATPPLELVLADGRRVELTGDLDIGRSPASSLRLGDPSVSRRHARIRASAGGTRAVIEDAGSSYGTLVDGEAVRAPVALRSGAKIRIGDEHIEVHARREKHEAGRTVVVPVGAAPVPLAGARPLLRSGYALKRLAASEGDGRWVVEDLRQGLYLRLGERDAALLALLDGTRSPADLVEAAERAHGDGALAALAHLVAELGERGMLTGIDPPSEGAAPRGWRRLLTPRELAFHSVPAIFDRAYRAGGWVLFTRPVAVVAGLICAAGIAAFATLVAGAHATPLAVGDTHPLAVGGLVFLAGRTLLVAVHELAHGLAMQAVGRRAERAGLKLVLVFPYAFVDTAAAWFEPRRRRAIVAAAGPVADGTIGGACAIGALALAGSTLGEILFQVAVAGYVAAFFNLNPLLERDGYHLLADRLGTPGLRERARRHVRARLAGERVARDPALGRYAVAGFAWSLAVAAAVIACSLRYQPDLSALASPAIAWGALAALWLAVLVPAAVVLRPALGRARRAMVGEPLVDRP